MAFVFSELRSLFNVAKWNIFYDVVDPHSGNTTTTALADWSGITWLRYSFRRLLRGKTNGSSANEVGSFHGFIRLYWAILGYCFFHVVAAAIRFDAKRKKGIRSYEPRSDVDE